MGSFPEPLTKVLGSGIQEYQAPSLHECRLEKMAEDEGFEPPVPVKVQRFSRPPPSTARPILRIKEPRF